jgi:hypothetical protein
LNIPTTSLQEYIHPNVYGTITKTGTTAGEGVLFATTIDKNTNCTSANRLKLSFVLEHMDDSNNTGFTMFDFDNDGINEICYRDRTHLRIIKPTRPYIVHDYTGSDVILLRTDLYSETGYEYPVIADIDGDASADMVIAGGSSSNWRYFDHMFAVSTNGDKFAPAWPVWNQFLYDPFKISPDSLTTPIGPAPNRLLYKFDREIKNTSGVVTKVIKDYQPFNGNMIQATYIDPTIFPKYEPLVYLVDAYIYGSATSKAPKIRTDGNNTNIDIWIKNLPSANATITSNMPIAVYKNNTISEATRVFKKTLAEVRPITGSGTGTIGSSALGNSFSLTPGSEAHIALVLGATGTYSPDDVYIVRLGDDSNGSIWQFGYNGGEKYGTDYPCDDFAEGLGTANRAFRDCNWCNQVVRAARYQIFRDLYTIQEFTDVTMDLLSNDILPIVPLASNPSQSFMDTVRLAPWNIVTPPTSGYLSFNNVQGAGARVIYTHDDRSNIPANIDSFQYSLTYYDDTKQALDTKTGTVYIYILKSASGGFSSCYGKATRIELQNLPANVSFEWYKTKTSSLKLQADARHRITGEMKGDSTYWLKPVTSGITATGGLTTAQINHYKTLNFPRGELKVRLVSYQATTTPLMRWTGHVDRKWKNPKNWVMVRTATTKAKEQESPVDFSPSECTDVIIPSDDRVNNFPELTDTAICNNIELKDRAMLKNPHVLKYAKAKVEFKLKPSEMNRFVMWSAPLKAMYSGDYHFSDVAGPRWGDVFMNFYQQLPPGITGSNGQSYYFTYTFSNTNVPLPLGQSFNLKVEANSLTRDNLLRFPRSESSYQGNTLDRTGEGRFITDGKSIPFTMDVRGSTGQSQFVQVVNPYMAYLDIVPFLAANSSKLRNGYYIWDGEVGSGLTAHAFANVDYNSSSQYYRILANADMGLLSTSPRYIAPLQSFFVGTLSNYYYLLTELQMSPEWTTTSPINSYTLRSSVKSGGVLNVTLSGANKQAHAALVYELGANNLASDRIDMPAVTYTIEGENPLSVYTFSAEMSPLIINASSAFDMQPVKLGFVARSNGEYKLEFRNLHSFGFDVVLVDKAQNYKQIDLKKTPEYTFTVSNPTSTVGQIEENNRFELRFAYTGHGITISSTEDNPPSSELHVSSGRGYIQLWSDSSPIGSLDIYNSLGKLIYSNPDVNDKQLRINVPARQMYIVKAMLGGEQKIVKTIIK